MDIGYLYIRDKAASQAAMGLGRVVFFLFIFIPYIFIPLYLILLIAGAFRGFRVENPALTFLLPLAPFAAACVLCIVFWWAIPFLVNTADMILDAFKSIFVSNNSISFFREDIPNEKCFLYFIAVIGGSIGTLFSIMSIGILYENQTSIKTKENRAISLSYQYPGLKSQIANSIPNETWEIRSDYRNGRISFLEANERIKQYFKSWIGQRHGIYGKDAESLWERYRSLMDVTHIRFEQSNSHNSQSKWDGIQNDNLCSVAHCTYLEQEYNVKKWKERQKRKQDKRH